MSLVALAMFLAVPPAPVRAATDGTTQSNPPPESQGYQCERRREPPTT